MGISDRIEAFILELMKQDSDEWLTIQRNEMAELFGCVPSQINYVISTRFSPERGYEVVSRRGGGGCVRIKHIDPQKSEKLTEGEALKEIANMVSSGYITDAEAKIMRAAVSDEALGRDEKSGTLRASVLNSMKKAAKRGSDQG